MQPAHKKLLIAAGLIAAIIVALILAAPSLQQALFYPKPRNLPPVVSQTITQLLAQLQAVLETNAPVVAESLQPGLTDAQIAELEAQGGFQLTEDLKALYRWHNGMSTNSTAGLLPGQHFLTLDETVRLRAAAHQEGPSLPAHQRVGLAVVAGHKRGWVQVLDDGAGDGFFFDPERAESEGSFFYHFTEDSHYVWFPSLRNFLGSLIECHQRRIVRMAADGKDLDADFEQMMKSWERFGKSSVSGN